MLHEVQKVHLGETLSQNVEEVMNRVCQMICLVTEMSILIKLTSVYSKREGVGGLITDHKEQ